MAHVEHAFILPTTANDGDSVQSVLFKQLEQRVLRACGGWTKVKSEGGWIDPKTGQVHIEPGVRYTVAVDTLDHDTTKRLHDVVVWAKDAWGQEAIYYSTQGVVDFISLAAVRPVFQPELQAVYGLRAPGSCVRLDMPRSYGITSLLIEDTPDAQSYLKTLWNKPTAFPLVDGPVLLARLACKTPSPKQTPFAWVSTHCPNGIILAGDREMLDHDTETEVCFLADVA